MALLKSSNAVLSNDLLGAIAPREVYDENDNYVEDAPAVADSVYAQLSEVIEDYHDNYSVGDTIVFTCTNVDGHCVVYALDNRTYNLEQVYQFDRL